MGGRWDGGYGDGLRRKRGTEGKRKGKLAGEGGFGAGFLEKKLAGEGEFELDFFREEAEERAEDF